MVRRLVQEVTSTGIAPDGLRTIVYGGGPLYPGDARAAGDALGPVFAQIYGQGECPMTITAQSRSDFSAALARGDDAFLQAVGRPFLGGEVRIVDAAEKPLASGEVGEIIVRGRAMCLGYWKDQAATTRTFGGGWLRTGDLGRMDDTGMVTLAGRSKEVIITGGSNVYPIEVEAVLLDHPDVQEAAVIGVAHPDWGEAVTAYVTSNRDDGELMTELDALCRDRIARFKCPKTYHIRDALPKNAYGKIVKRDLA
jgi:long-chain acyl-CoA synthetase